MSKIKNHRVAEAFNACPVNVRKKLLRLRKMVLDTASELEEVSTLEETLKWGQPSYIANTGSTLRLGWNRSRPDQYRMLFNCNSKLVDTFKELYSDQFSFEGNRAIVFDVSEVVSDAALKHCIVLCLTYHRRKNLPLLGA